MKTYISPKHIPGHLIVVAVALIVMISSRTFGQEKLKTAKAKIDLSPTEVEGTVELGKEVPAEPAKLTTPPGNKKGSEEQVKKAPAKPVRAKSPAVADPLPSTKISEIKQSGSAQDKADDAAENLSAALEVIAGNSKKLYETYEQAQIAIRELSSYRSDFDRGGEDDIGKLLTKMDKVRVPVERIYAILPDALAAARAFRKQFPDFKTLDKLVRDGTKFNGHEAIKQVERIEEFPEEWLGEVNIVINGALEEADSNISQYGLDNLDSLQGNDKELKYSAADAAEKWVLDYSTIMIETINTMLPELPKTAQSSLPEFVAARQDYLKRAADMEESIEKVADAVSETRDEVVKADLRRLGDSRFPKSKYTGGEWSDAEKDIRDAWAQKIKDKKLVKVAIYSPWEINKEARLDNGSWVVGKYRYIGANCLAKLSSGKYMVYRMMFRNTMQEDESWSPLEQCSVGRVYEILEDNIGE